MNEVKLTVDLGEKLDSLLSDIGINIELKKGLSEVISESLKFYEKRLPENSWYYEFDSDEIAACVVGFTLVSQELYGVDETRKLLALVKEQYATQYEIPSIFL